MLLTIGTAAAFELCKTEAGGTCRWYVRAIPFAVSDATIGPVLPGELAYTFSEAAYPWEEALGFEMEFTYDGFTDVEVMEDDGVNTVFFSDNIYQWAENDQNPDTEVNAWTRKHVYTQSGEIVGFDLVLSSQAAFTAESEVAEDETDLLGVLTHEIGHALGLSHSLDPEATMYAEYDDGETWMRTLETDDVQGLWVLYADGWPEEVDTGSRLACSSTGASALSGLPTLSALLLFALKRRNPAAL
jgi:hypothetical protein